MPPRIQALRRHAFDRQGGRCYYCRISMWLLTSDELPARDLPAGLAARLKCTAEHLLPKSEGGRNTADNVVAACAHCNRTRHKRKYPPMPDVYRRQVERRVERGAWHNPWVFEHGLLGPVVRRAASIAETEVTVATR